MRRWLAIVAAVLLTTVLLLTLMPAIAEAIWRHITGGGFLSVKVYLYDERSGRVIDVIKPERPFVSIWDVLRGRVNPHYIENVEVPDENASYVHLVIAPQIRIEYTIDPKWAGKIVIKWQTYCNYLTADSPPSQIASEGSKSDEYHIPCTTIESGVWYDLHQFVDKGLNKQDPRYDKTVADIYNIFHSNNLDEGYIHYQISASAELWDTAHNTKLASTSTVTAQVDIHYKFVVEGAINSFDVQISWGT